MYLDSPMLRTSYQPNHLGHIDVGEPPICVLTCLYIPQNVMSLITSVHTIRQWEIKRWLTKNDGVIFEVR
jgi:hypothetical protein